MSKGSPVPLGATDSGIRPSDYPLGSRQSRAAARAILARRLAGRKRTELIIISSVPRPQSDGIRIGEWRECTDRTLTRISLLPPGMTMREAERVVSERTRLLTP